MLIDVTILKAKELGFKKLYLFTFDSTIAKYYVSLGWQKIGVGEFIVFLLFIDSLSSLGFIKFT